VSSRAIAVIGMGRSGTSYITEFLGACGVFLDDVNWAHEHELGRLVNDTFLEREFGARRGRPYGNLPPDPIEPDESWSKLATQFVAYMSLRAADESASNWAFKDPRTTVLHRMWLQHFDAVVAIYRRPDDVAASYMGQGWIRGVRRKNRALSYWKRFNQSVLAIHDACEGVRPFYLVDYDGDLDEQGELLTTALGLELTDKARALYDPSLKHYADRPSTADAGARALYAQLQAARINA
jgi:hypothetical protein